MNVIDPALPASQFLDRGSSTTNSSLVLTNARISARSTVVTDGPVALTCLAVRFNQTPRYPGVRNRSCLLTGVSHINVPIERRRQASA